VSKSKSTNNLAPGISSANADTLLMLLKGVKATSKQIRSKYGHASFRLRVAEEAAELLIACIESDSLSLVMCEMLDVAGLTELLSTQPEIGEKYVSSDDQREVGLGAGIWLSDKSQRGLTRGIPKTVRLAESIQDEAASSVLSSRLSPNRFKTGY